MSLTPANRLYILGAILLVALIVCARTFSGHGEAFPLTPLLVAAITYLLAVREFFCTPQLSKRVIIVGVIFAAVWHAAFLAIPTGSDDDIRRYLWDGRLQQLGYNPYLVIPNDPAFASLHTHETRALNNPHLPTIYPPGAELFFRAVTAIHESTRAMRVAFVLCEVVLVLGLLDILRRTGQPMHWVLAFVWNPLLVTAVAGSGHVDIVGAMLLVISLAALLRRWTTIAALSFAFAVAVKFLPVVLLPLYWRRVRLREGVLAALLLAVIYVPFLDHGRIPLGSLGAYIQGFGFNDPVFAMLRRVAPPQILAAFAVIIGLLTAAWFRSRVTTLSPDGFAWPMATTLVCAPVIFPWYLLWLLPFARSRSTIPLLVWTVAILPTYIVWHLRMRGHPFELPVWVMVLEYGVVAVAAVIVLARQRAGMAVR